ncbi:MAG: hypothetical protein IT233_04560 [Bacteroidia bacterium]|nr:hypothetical protein [Bacteroidia bacterium]
MPDKLESKIKESLHDTGIPFDPSGWERLERDLDARGSKTSFKLNVNWKYSLNTVLVVAAASALVWGIVAISGEIRDWAGKEQVPVNSVGEPPQPILTQTPVPVVSSPQEKTPVDAGNKEVVVQQFFPTQVYTIPYPYYNVPQYPVQQNDQMALEDPEQIDGEFSDVVKNRPVLTNPLLRHYMLGESSLSKQPENNVQNAGSEMKLTPEEMKLFRDITLTRGRGELIFGDQIDPRKGIVGKSKEGDSLNTIFFSQDAPTQLPLPADSLKQTAPK